MNFVSTLLATPYVTPHQQYVPPRLQKKITHYYMYYATTTMQEKWKIAENNNLVYWLIENNVIT